MTMIKKPCVGCGKEIWTMYDVTPLCRVCKDNPAPIIADLRKHEQFDEAMREGDRSLHAQLLADNAALRAKVEQAQIESAQETEEFNAGYDAAKNGEPPTEPSGCKYDVWLIGWVWGDFQKRASEATS